MNKLLKQTLIIFIMGIIESFGYTLYLIAVNKYMILVSSILMFLYMIVYLWIVKQTSSEKNSLLLLAAYAAACGLGNALAMMMHLIK